MYVRHGGASRLALVPQLQLCVTDNNGLILWIRICRKSNLRLKLRLAGLSFKKGGKNQHRQCLPGFCWGADLKHQVGWSGSSTDSPRILD